MKQVLQLIELNTYAIVRNHEEAWISGVVLNIMQIQTITACCQCKQEPKGRLQAIFKLEAQYLDKYLKHRRISCTRR